MIPLKIESLNKKYKKIKALDNLSFEVQRGKLYGFIGSNGAGKTTTIDIVANILKADSGTLEVFGEKLKPGDWKYKSEVGFVLEKPRYIEHLTGKEYLEFAGVMFNLEKDDIKKRVDDLIELLDLSDKKDELIKTYSKGMKKKISLAGALIHSPELLILDEPLEGIDPVSSNRIKKLLKSLTEKGKTVFVSSHELNTLEDVCDEMIIIHKGKNIFQGTTEELKVKCGNSDKDLTKLSLEEMFVQLIGEDKKEVSLDW